MTASDGRKSPEARERARERGIGQWDDPDRRRRHGDLTRERMNDPAVRQRIRDGMQRAAADVPELQALKFAWQHARPCVREQFLFELLRPLWGPVK
jgi:hypothetical protein